MRYLVRTKGILWPQISHTLVIQVRNFLKEGPQTKRSGQISRDPQQKHLLLKLGLPYPYIYHLKPYASLNLGGCYRKSELESVLSAWVRVRESPSKSKELKLSLTPQALLSHEKNSLSPMMLTIPFTCLSGVNGKMESYLPRHVSTPNHDTG